MLTEYTTVKELKEFLNHIPEWIPVRVQTGGINRAVTGFWVAENPSVVIFNTNKTVDENAQ